MRRSRRRSSRRGQRRAGRIGVACAVVLAVAGFAPLVLPAASVELGAAPRGSGVDVVGDDAAVQGLDTAPEVRINHTDPLTNVTNRFGRTVTVTVTLRDDAADVGDLVVDGVVEGNSTTFSLGSGVSESVSIRIPDDADLTDRTVYFHVESTAPGVSASTPDRSVPVNA